MNGVKVQSIDLLKHLRGALIRFGETAGSVLSDIDGELQRSLNWLETEATARWQHEIRKRQEALAKAKDALRAKKLFQPDGSKPSVVDEEKAVRLATARLEEAGAKLAAVQRYSVVLHKEVMQYRGQVQRFGNTVSIDIPIAVGRLEAMIRHLETYMTLRPEEPAMQVGTTGAASGEAPSDEGLPSMARAAEEPPQQPSAKEPHKGTPGEAREGGPHGRL